MQGVVGVEQDPGVGGRQAVGARPLVPTAALDLEQPGDGLLLQPLARVALVDAGALGQLGRGRGPAVAQDPAEAEPQPA